MRRRGKRGVLIRRVNFAAVCMFLLAVQPARAELPAPITRDNVTLRVIGAGEFPSSLAQGLEFDLVNASEKPILSEVRLTLFRDGVVVQRADRAEVSIPAHARHGFRVAEPLTYGTCRLEYEVTVNGATFASGQFGFQATGPYRLRTRPWFLSQNAVGVQLDLLQPSDRPERYRFRLLDAERKRVLFETEQHTRVVDTSPYARSPNPLTTIESFLRFGRERAGEYIVEVEVIDATGQAPATKARLLHAARHSSVASDGGQIEP